MLALLCLGNSSWAWAQKTIVNFEVSLDGKIIGGMVATKEVNGDEVNYTLHSDVEAKVLRMSVEVESELEMRTKDQILISGTSYQYSNRGKSNISASVKRQEDKTYKAVKNGKTRVLPISQIQNTVTDLYFREPVGVSTVYSIADADFLSIESKENGLYLLILSNGKRNTFTYVDGYLEKMRAPILGGAVEIKRK